MLTDVYFAEHTMIDPYTDAIQMVGRFRNGVSSITHISNVKEGIPQRTKEEIKRIYCLQQGDISNNEELL